MRFDQQIPKPANQRPSHVMVLGNSILLSARLI